MKNIFQLMVIIILFSPSAPLKAEIAMLDVKEAEGIKKIITNGKEWAYTWNEKAGGADKWHIATSFGENIPYDMIYDLRVTPDGKKLVYFLKLNDKFYVHVNKDKAGPFDMIYNITYSQDGNSLAYSIKNENREYVYNGLKRISGPLNFLHALEFHHDGKTVKYRTFEDIHRKDNKEPTGGDNKKNEPQPVEKKFAEITNIGDKEFIRIGKEKFGPFDGIYNEKVSPDGKTFIFCAKLNDKHFIYTGNKKIGPFDYVMNVEFFQEGKSLVYSVKMENRVYLFAGKDKIGPFDSVSALTVSRDGKILSFTGSAAGIETNYTYFNGKKYTGSLWNDYLIYIDGPRLIIEDLRKNP